MNWVRNQKTSGAQTDAEDMAYLRIFWRVPTRSSRGEALGSLQKTHAEIRRNEQTQETTIKIRPAGNPEPKVEALQEVQAAIERCKALD